jgi:kinesin family protein 20
LFQSFFVGDGKAVGFDSTPYSLSPGPEQLAPNPQVMIVNVNPYETSFDENSHVMKFSAVAKGIMTVKNNVPVPVLPVLATPVRKEPRVVRLSIVEGGEEEDVIYEGERGKGGLGFAATCLLTSLTCCAQKRMRLKRRTRARTSLSTRCLRS